MRFVSKRKPVLTILLALTLLQLNFNMAGAAPVNAPMLKVAPPPGKLAYVLDHDIYLLDVQSGEQAAITHDGDALDARWLPDGQRLLYTEGQSSTTKTSLLNAQSGKKTTLPTEAGQGVFSPDGKYLAYNDEQSRIAVLDLQTLGVNVLTTNANDDSYPSFGDDDSLYFIRRVRGSNDLFTATLIMRVDTKRVETTVYDTKNDGNLCPASGLDVYKHDWLAFSFSCGAHGRSVSVLDLKSGVASDVSNYFSGQQCEYLDGWAHNTARLAVLDSTYCNEPTGSDTSIQNLVIVSFDNVKHTGKAVAPGEQNAFAEWSPDDQWLVFTHYSTAGESQGIWLVGSQDVPAFQLTQKGEKPHWSPTGASGSNSHTFTETGYTVSGRFWDVWQSGHSYDQSLYINGYPITAAQDEVSLTDGKTYQVQWFERARFELHPENAAPNYVLLGLLGVQAAEGHEGEIAFMPVQKPTGNVPWFKETQHTIGDGSAGGMAIDTYWKRFGGLVQFGYPISQPFMEKNAGDGQMYLVQYFERQRLEYHPENVGTGFEVLLGRLGAEQFRGPNFPK